MSATFSELVVRGNFPLVKGFLVGYLCGRNSQARYFFRHTAGTIKRDSVTGMIKQLVELDSEIHVCLETSEVDGFRNAVDAASPKIGIGLAEARPIALAEFEYSCELYDPEEGGKCREIFRAAKETLTLEGFNEKEIVDAKAMKEPLHKAHPYTYSSAGRVRGDFDEVMNVFLQLKRLTCRDFVKCGEMVLHYN